jgi:hypothetical protein
MKEDNVPRLPKYSFRHYIIINGEPHEGTVYFDMPPLNKPAQGDFIPIVSSNGLFKKIRITRSRSVENHSQTWFGITLFGDDNQMLFHAEIFEYDIQDGPKTIKVPVYDIQGQKYLVYDFEGGHKLLTSYIQFTILS